MRTAIEWVLKRLGFHVCDDRRLFLVKNICFVKCMGCGAESIPWYVSEEKAAASREDHKNDVADLAAFEKRA